METKAISKEEMLYAIMLAMLDEAGLSTNASIYCLAPSQLLPPVKERVNTPTFADKDPGIRINLGSDACWVLNALNKLADNNELKAAIHSARKLVTGPEDDEDEEEFYDPFSDVWDKPI